MALIRCSECGKEVSTQATACPHCGCPVAVILKEGATASDPQPAPKPPEPLDPKWEKWGSQQATAPPASTASSAPAQQSAGHPQQQAKAGKGFGCLGIIIVSALLAWILDIAGCNSGSVSPAFSAGYAVGQAAGKIDGAPGRRPPSDGDLNIAARQTLRSSEFANGSQEDQEKYMDGFKSGYESGFKEASKPAF